MISEAVGAMASVFALSFLENFPHHRGRHLWGLQHVPLLLFLGCSRLLGKPDTGGKQKAKPKRPVFLPLDTRVTIILRYCFYLLEQAELYDFSFCSIIPLSQSCGWRVN